MLFYKPSLERIGITVSVRTIDSSQYENRLRQWDFDIIIASWGESLSPGNEQRGYWSSQAADIPGSRNLIGIKNPAVDALDRARDLFQGAATSWSPPPRRSTACCCGITTWCRNGPIGKLAHRALGSFQPSGDHAEIRPIGVSHDLVVGRGQGGQGAAAVLITRRHALVLSAGAIAAAKFIGPARAQAAERHGMSAFGDLAYPADFPHFNYVNPDAPKGGVFSQIGPNRQYNQSFLTFNSLNSYILKGDGAQGMELTFATLMVRSGDEPDAMYGLAARGVRISDDGLTYTFLLRARGEIPRRHAAHRA